MPSLQAPIAITGPEDFAEVFKVPRETIHRLGIYAELLAEWQQRHNLVSSSTIPHLWQRHFADSAQLLALAPKGKIWLDLGSGAGFPGLVAAIMANQGDLQMHLVEATAKKCAFLAEVAKATNTAVDIRCMRIEDLACHESKLEPDVVSARALAPLPKLLELATPFFRRGTRGLFLKGRDAKAEIDTASKQWRFDFRLHPSRTASDSSIVEISNPAKIRQGRKR